MTVNRRALILGAGFATAAPALVRATSLIDLPGDPLTARGLFAASKWASEEFSELPGCRVVFADGQSTRWMNYTCMSRPTGDKQGRTFVVAIEVSTTDAAGKRFITSVPVDGARLARDQGVKRARMMRDWAEYTPPGPWDDDDEIPF